MLRMMKVPPQFCHTTKIKELGKLPRSIVVEKVSRRLFYLKLLNLLRKTANSLLKPRNLSRAINPRILNPRKIGLKKTPHLFSSQIILSSSLRVSILMDLARKWKNSIQRYNKRKNCRPIFYPWKKYIILIKSAKSWKKPNFITILNLSIMSSISSTKNCCLGQTNICFLFMIFLKYLPFILKAKRCSLEWILAFTPLLGLFKDLFHQQTRI